VIFGAVLAPAAVAAPLLPAGAVPAAGGQAGLDVLTNLALILCVAAVTTVLFQKIRQPVVLGYLLAGLIVGPHLSVPLFADAALAHRLSELGVVLLMFSLGLEFSLRKLARVAPISGITGLVECSLMICLGYVAGRALGWSEQESLFTGALVAISSTTIVVKAFAEQGVRGPRAELVLGILVAEDVLAILFIAILAALASRTGFTAAGLAWTIARLAGFLLSLLGFGMLLVPRLVRLIVRLDRSETTIVASVGLCFASAFFGYSVALGAFLGGALVAESGEAKRIERAIEPVRDVFAAIFFVSVGMLIDPAILAEHWPAVLVLTVVVVLGKATGVTIGAFVSGNGVRASVQAGMSLGQIGEFSFIIAGLGVALGATGGFLYPVAIAVSAFTTLLTPWLIRASGPFASWVDRRLPPALQTYAALYGSWVEQIRRSPRQRAGGSPLRRRAGLLFLDIVIIAAIVVTASRSAGWLVEFGVRYAKLTRPVARVLVVLGGLAAAAPFLIGAVRMARALGQALALEALPAGRGLDLAAAPRRALLVTLQIALLFVAGLPLVAITQPFLGSFPGFAVWIVGVLLLIVPFWRSATNLQGHVRAGAQVILEAINAQSRAGDRDERTGEAVRLMPGLGDASTLALEPGHAAVGRTLKEIGLRGLTGATVLAIDRASGDRVLPTGDEPLAAGDTLVLTGTGEAVAAAKRQLVQGAAAEDGSRAVAEEPDGSPPPRQES
jgi:monovalent cation:H+ antiporter-2, CPA2 family